jgi:hypothetical protein
VLLSHEQPPECKSAVLTMAVMAIEMSNESAASLIQSVTSFTISRRLDCPRVLMARLPERSNFLAIFLWKHRPFAQHADLWAASPYFSLKS